MTHTNPLVDETSPYLLQHAHNPVHWYPWGDEALDLAKREDKPILLSIGYSACHWCHVMAHESFEDEATAERMNALFVNIKVDREERPDLDKIYQLSHQLLTRSNGGWPLTVFLNPHDLVPFFSGTYFPRQARYNLPGFTDLLDKVEAHYRVNQDALAQHSGAFLTALTSLSDQAGASPDIDVSLLPRASSQMGSNFDPQWGGFGGAPKFPHPTSLEFLLRGKRGETDRHSVFFTLRKMAEGGLYDQVGGGFFRYSVDARWEIPHFEKMLYDNGPLLALYSQAHSLTGAPLFRRIAVETAEWVMREMQSPQGGYYSSLDADSEGEEGKFYTWRRQQLVSLLSEQEYALLAPHYGLEEAPNFEGHWHFHLALSLDEIAQRLGIADHEAESLQASARVKLQAAREQRIRPGRDEKILVSWNAMMIRGMAIAGRLLQREDFIASARRAFVFLHQELFREGRLLASWKEGRARFPAYLDDHAFLIDAALELLQSRWESSILDWAVNLADELLLRFEDTPNGGFFFTAHDHETLIHRPKPTLDEAMPSGNGVAALALARLGQMLGEPRYSQAAENTLRAATGSMQRHPHAYGSLLNALDEWVSPPSIIVLRGREQEMEPWRRALMADYSPARLCLAIPEGEIGLPGLLAERKPERTVVAYVCEANRCRSTIRSLAEFQRLLTA
ncbi:MAG: thioredoxin domain-containing protein [Methylococcaceae bacterium]|nr:thioredoxin domain-containing protein [Methylococcaceae bacterium]